MKENGCCVIGTMDKNQQHLTSIDGLKGIGAFIIAFVWHYQHFLPSSPPPHLFKLIFSVSYKLGWSLVDLFFILSGFCLMIGYGKRIAGHSISFKEFILKRVRKLYPIFLLSTVIVLALELAYKHKEGATFVYSNYDFSHLIQNILLLQDGIIGTEFSFNAPSWYISIYLVCYCLFYYILHSRRENYFCIFAFIGLIGIALEASGLSFPIVNTMMGRGMAGFSIGVLLTRANENKLRFRSMKLGYCCLICLVAIWIVLRFKSIDYAGDFSLAMLMGVGPMILLSSLFIPWLNTLVSSKVLRYLGSISLEIYLFHFPIQCCIKVAEIYLGLKMNYANEITWVIYMTITLVIASIYHFFFANKVERFVSYFFIIKDRKEEQ